MKMRSFQLVNDMVVITAILVLTSTTGVNGIFCFKCLAIDCSPEDAECRDIRSFIQKQLEPLYFFDGGVAPCPKQDLDGRNEFRLMQISDSECPAVESGDDYCALGRMQIRIQESVTTAGNVASSSQVRHHHATILGCAKWALHNRINAAFKIGKACDYLVRNTTFGGKFLQLKIEHCAKLDMECRHTDYCINWQDSDIRPWTRFVTTPPLFQLSTIVAGLGILFVALTILVVCGLWIQYHRIEREVARRPAAAHLPKSKINVPKLQAIHMPLPKKSASATIKPCVRPPPPGSPQPPQQFAMKSPGSQKGEEEA